MPGGGNDDAAADVEWRHATFFFTLRNNADGMQQQLSRTGKNIGEFKVESILNVGHLSIPTGQFHEEKTPDSRRGEKKSSRSRSCWEIGNVHSCSVPLENIE